MEAEQKWKFFLREERLERKILKLRDKPQVALYLDDEWVILTIQFFSQTWSLNSYTIAQLSRWNEWRIPFPAEDRLARFIFKLIPFSNEGKRERRKKRAKKGKQWREKEPNSSHVTVHRRNENKWKRRGRWKFARFVSLLGRGERLTIRREISWYAISLSESLICGEKNKYSNYRRLYLYVYINFIIRLFFFYHVHVICDAILTSWINEGPLFLKVLDGSACNTY